MIRLLPALGLILLMGGCVERVVELHVSEGPPDEEPRDDLLARLRLEYPTDPSNASRSTGTVFVPDNATRLRFDVEMYRSGTLAAQMPGLMRSLPYHNLTGVDERGQVRLCYAHRGDRTAIPDGRPVRLFFDQDFVRRTPRDGNLTFQVEGPGDWWVLLEIHAVDRNADSDDIEPWDRPHPGAKCPTQD